MSCYLPRHLAHKARLRQTRRMENVWPSSTVRPATSSSQLAARAGKLATFWDDRPESSAAHLNWLRLPYCLRTRGWIWRPPAETPRTLPPISRRSPSSLDLRAISDRRRHETHDGARANYSKRETARQCRVARERYRLASRRRRKAGSLAVQRDHVCKGLSTRRRLRWSSVSPASDFRDCHNLLSRQIA